jgi:membrane associated rhomboid family serine protease
MYVLFVFGKHVEEIFIQFQEMGELGFAPLHYLMLYLGGIVFSVLITLIKHRDNYAYNAVGASGAVSSILFTFIFFLPWQKIYFFGIIPIPGIAFALLYIVYSHVMSRRDIDNINHDAHLLGALYGFVYPILVKPSFFIAFINELTRLK